MYRQRQLATALQNALAGFPAVLVTGPRQSGKTTFLRHEAGEQLDYVSFDDPLERDFAAVDPAGFLRRFADRPVILDEIQYVPELFSHLKLRIDADPGRCGRWLLTGSQQFGLMRDVSESLAGRVGILELPPFSYTEFPRSSLGETLWNGGYPIPALHPDRRDLWLRSYIATYIERDVRQIRNIPDLRTFNQFLNLAATRHGQEFHTADLARELGMTQPTVKSWGGVLEASYIAYFLPPWFRNYGKRVVKSSKFYFYDSALVTLLTRQPDAAAALAGQMGGPLLEGWVVTEAVKVFMALGRKPDLYFWRSHDGLEVDLLIVIDGKLQAVEIKLTATPGAGHVEPLNRFLAVAGDEANGQGLLVCRTEKQRALPNGHVALPWQSFPEWLQARLENSGLAAGKVSLLAGTQIRAKNS
ncbi:MAG: ATP-binding protein [Propionivibrio sp.]|uniref:ATP-binding protein n=1 Tax=Candidatus Propionivibrio dominans TaxID=2954373 RepID=A0A9D7F9X2_9RHOO|nr:ATP-binding protein [Candidatus Propionivibrio dominans]MBL0168429.1 ATP-binding protein [Propionivibrio sp.]